VARVSGILTRAVWVKNTHASASTSRDRTDRVDAQYRLAAVPPTTRKGISRLLVRVEEKPVRDLAIGVGDGPVAVGVHLELQGQVDEDVIGARRAILGQRSVGLHVELEEALVRDAGDALGGAVQQRRAGVEPEALGAPARIEADEVRLQPGALAGTTERRTSVSGERSSRS
jgi:hypothetical protein